MWSRVALKEHAKSILKLSYWKAVLVSLILAFVTGGSSGGSSAGGASSGTSSSQSSLSFSDMADTVNEYATLIASVIGVALVIFLLIFIIALAVDIFAWHPIEVGAQRFFFRSLSAPTSLNELGYAFSHSYMNVVKTQFLRYLYTFLWSLLLIVPGIIKSYEYRMMPYILAENPEMDAKEVFARSKAMMDGEKWNAFVLDLSFIGWDFLSIFTCFILSIFYVNPYRNLTNAELYSVLKQKVDGSTTQTNAVPPVAGTDNNTYNPYC